MGGRSARGFPDAGELNQRLWNWGAFSRRDPDKPDGSCVNPIWANFIPSKDWDEAWGEQVSPDPGSELDIDEDDAEVMDCWLRQLLTRNKSAAVVIVRRFAHRVWVPKLDVDAAVRALGDLIEANWRVVDKMEGRT